MGSLTKWRPCMRNDPTLKWLLNERAALAGKLAQLRERLPAQRKTAARLSGAATRYLGRAASAGARLIEMESQIPQLQARLHALDDTMRLVNERVDPTVAGTVNAWKGKFGERGALINFLRDTVREASPQPVSVAALLFAVEQRFGFPGVPSPGRKSLRDSVRARLRELRDREDCVVHLPASPTTPQPSWQWKQPPSLKDLQAAAYPALTAEAFDELDSVADPFRGEVAGQ